MNNVPAHIRNLDESYRKRAAAFSVLRVRESLTTTVLELRLFIQIVAKRTWGIGQE